MDVKKKLTTCALAVLMTGLGTQAFARASAEDYEKMMRAAEAAQAAAASVGGEWRDTGKMLDKAKKAASDGAYDKAIAIANQARQQGELGYKQALAEKNAGFPSYLQ